MSASEPPDDLTARPALPRGEEAAHSAEGGVRAHHAPLRIVIAPQALKGSLDAPEVGAAIAAGVRAVLPDARIEIVPVADGGEGTVRALVAATGGELRRITVTGPLGEPVEAEWGLLGGGGDYGERRGRGGDAEDSERKKDGEREAREASTKHAKEAERATAENAENAEVAGIGAGAYSIRPTGSGANRVELTAVIEMAAASGLPLVPPERRNPLLATTRGTGELMRAALDAGARRLLIGIGGSATNDGGAGMAQALGARLLDAAGNELPPGGAALADLARIDLSGLDARLAQTQVRVACDVSNLLTGPTGASAVYGPQKGATPTMVAQLDAALAHYAEVLRRDLGADVAEIPGSGAAGGLGAGLLAFAHAELVPGAALVLDALHFGERVAGADLVITAEGRLDEQTAYGKAPAAVARAAKVAGAAVIVLAGSVAMPDEALAALGFDAAVPLPNGPMTLEESMVRAPELVRAAAARALRLVVIGRRL
ncbi:MAG TPA: glycerate kinase [Ktedonobacterales bacterium]